MDVVLLVARLILALVFVVAGVGKLADLEGSRKAVADFGVPAVLANPIGMILPIFELAAAIALVSTDTAWHGAVLALGLLLLFILGMSVNLARGRTPDCHCFGQIHSEPVGPQSLIRNIGLAAIAGFIILFGHNDPGLSATAWFFNLTGAQQLAAVAFGALLVAAGAEVVLAYRLVAGNAQLRARIQALESGAAPDDVMRGLPVGAPAPPFKLRDLTGTTVTLDTLRADGRAVMLLFVDPNCGPCASLMPDVARWQREYDPGMTFALVSTGKRDANRAKVEEHGTNLVLLQKHFEVASAYKFGGTPSGVIVHPSGTIASPMAVGTDQIRALLDQYVELLAEKAGVALQDEGELERAIREAASPLEIGAPAPNFELAGPDGKITRTADLRGRDTVLLFWSSTCPFCYEMRPDLWEWEANRPEGAPELLVVVPNAEDVPQTARFRSRVVVDRDRIAAQALHGSATPTAVKIDAEGRIASQPATGAGAVFDLLGGRSAQRERIPA